MKSTKKLPYFALHALSVFLTVCTLSVLIPSIPVNAAVTPTAPDYSLVFDADYYHDKYEDLEKAYGKNPFQLFNHFLTLGMREGRQAIKSFNVYDYAANNLDLIVRFGTSDLSKYYIHYITEGYQEGRSCKTPYSVSDNTDTDNNTDVSADTLNSYARSLIDMINQARVSMGVNALGNTSDLASAASLRASDLMTLYSHTRPNGSNYSNALDIYGVNYSDSYEVIANGYTDPYAVMNDWTFNSDVSSSLTNKKYKHIGIGCSVDANGRYYWVMLLTS